MRAARRGLVVFTCVAALSPLVNARADAAHAATVVRYDADLSVSIATRSIAGRVVLTAAAVDGDAEHLLLDSGDIVVDAVAIDGRPASYSPMPRRIDVSLAPVLRKGQSRTVAVTYHVQPKRAVRFVGDPAQVYTIFTTSEWLPCIDAPDQKATLSLTLRFDSPVVAVGSGDRLMPRDDGPATVFRWNESKPVPTYTFGFAAGQFHRTESLRHGVRLAYLGGLPDGDLSRVFRETPDMLDFFESRSGVRYRGGAYTQVLTAGPAEQEADRFTLLSTTYGEGLLKDASDVWLQAHEFAHQWWGNAVTCRSWNDFWLNEGMATFMADAYKEHRFGREAYMTEIDASRKRYERVRDEGHDHALVYESWASPTAADRTIVYHKGAYVLHLLRTEMGDELFWRGIRAYTRAHVGKSVVTRDFQREMERSAGRDLSAFFAKWVYR